MSTLQERRVLVTGGAGFIGSRVARKLSRNHQVIILDNLSSGDRRNLPSNNNLTLVEGDILDKHTVEHSLRGVATVIHLAAIASVPLSIANPIETTQVNVNGTLSLLMASKRMGVKRFIFASSSAVYGNPQHLPVRESATLNALSTYAASKIAAEKYCEAFQHNYGLSAISLRLFNVYGSRMFGHYQANVVDEFMRALKAKARPLVFGDGNQARDFVNVSDVVDLMVRLVELPVIPAGSFNVGSGKATTIHQLLNTIASVLRLPSPEPSYADSRKGDIRKSQADISKAATMLGFKPLVTLRSGLKAMIDDGIE